jgi:hypothetical protein
MYSKMSLFTIGVQVGAETYIDPASGYDVFTEVALRKRPCCGNRLGLEIKKILKNTLKLCW